MRPDPVKPQTQWERNEARNREAARRGAGRRDVVGQIDRSKPTVETPWYMRHRGCIRREGVKDWCDAHGAYFVAGRMFCWATVRPSDVDPLNALPAEPRPTSPPVVDDRWMLLFWVAVGLGFLLICAVGAYLVGLRPPHA